MQETSLEGAISVLGNEMEKGERLRQMEKGLSPQGKEIVDAMRESYQEGLARARAGFERASVARDRESRSRVNLSFLGGVITATVFYLYAPEMIPKMNGILQQLPTYLNQAIEAIRQLYS